MIGKITIGKSFGGCIKYCLNDKLQLTNDEQIIKHRAEVLLYHQCYGTEKELVQQFNEVRQLNNKLSKPVLHITLSLVPGEQLHKHQLADITEQCATDLGFANNQYIAVQHHDTKHQHIHIIANRIGFDARTVSDSNNYQKIATFCRKMEQQYQLKQILNPKQFLSKEQRQLQRIDIRKQQIKQHIKEALQTSKQFTDFEAKMKQRGYQIIKGRGIAFIDAKKVYVKGSELGYSLQIIERQLQKNRLLQTFKQTQHNITMNQNINVATSIKENQSLSKGIGNTLEQLIKPELTQQQEINEDLIKRKKKHQVQRI